MKILFLDIDGVIKPWKAEKDESGRFGKVAENREDKISTGGRI